VSDVINQDGTIKQFFISRFDGIRFEFDRDLRSEIQRYLIFLFSVPTAESRNRISRSGTNIPLFSTQKKSYFSSNTLAQNFSYQDKLIQRHFKASAVGSLGPRNQNLLREAKSDSYI
jgi:hypothetical protein